MNKIVTNRGEAVLGKPEPEDFASYHDYVWSLAHWEASRNTNPGGVVQIAPGFEDKAVVSMNQPPPQHDWSKPLAKLADLKEEFAGMEPVKMSITVQLEGYQPWTITLTKVPRKMAKEISALVKVTLADATLELDREFKVGDNNG